MERHDTFGNKINYQETPPIAVFYEKTGGTLRSIYEENIFTEGADSGKIV